LESQLQLQHLNQQHQLLLQNQYQGQHQPSLVQYPTYGNNLPYNPHHQQQQLLMQALLLQQQIRPQLHIMSPNNLQYGQESQQALLNHYYQQPQQQQQQQQQQRLIAMQQLAMQQQLINHPESPFVAINNQSPCPETVSPLSQQRSPLNVALYLPQAAKVDAHVDIVSKPEQVSVHKIFPRSIAQFLRQDLISYYNHDQ